MSLEECSRGQLLERFGPVLYHRFLAPKSLEERKAFLQEVGQMAVGMLLVEGHEIKCLTNQGGLTTREKLQVGCRVARPVTYKKKVYHAYWTEQWIHAPKHLPEGVEYVDPERYA